MTTMTMEQMGQQMDTVFKQFQQGHWKASQQAIVLTRAEAQTIKESFEWFHGVTATIENTTAVINHKEGLVSFEVPAFKVISPGYGC